MDNANEWMRSTRKITALYLKIAENRYFYLSFVWLGFFFLLVSGNLRGVRIRFGFDGVTEAAGPQRNSLLHSRSHFVYLFCLFLAFIAASLSSLQLQCSDQTKEKNKTHTVIMNILQMLNMLLAKGNKKKNKTKQNRQVYLCLYFSYWNNNNKC